MGNGCGNGYGYGYRFGSLCPDFGGGPGTSEGNYLGPTHLYGDSTEGLDGNGTSLSLSFGDGDED